VADAVEIPPPDPAVDPVEVPPPDPAAGPVVVPPPAPGPVAVAVLAAWPPRQPAAVKRPATANETAMTPSAHLHERKEVMVSRLSPGRRGGAGS
jgi:hypothetical protein